MKTALSIILLLLAGLTACSPQPAQHPLPTNPQRIISLAPSITESLCTVGATSNLIGITTFCNYPPAITHLPRIGGYTDTNYERILSLRPDLVVALDEHAVACKRFDELAIPYIQIDTSSIGALTNSLIQLGEATGHPEQAKQAVNQLQQEIASIQRKTALLPKRRVLISIGRNMGTGGLSDVYLAGPGTLYDELLSLCNAENVYSGKVDYARISKEGLQRMNPEIIIDLVPDLDQSKSLTKEQVRSDWFSLKEVTAIQHDAVYLFGGDYVCIPGPRIVQLLRDIAAAIHGPELLP
jgi:iron complex transport system substrate-binding protein